MFAKIRKILLRIALWFVGITFIWVLLCRFVPIPLTYLMIERAVAQKLQGQEVRMDRYWVSQDEIAMNMKRAVIASEDQSFMNHFGFDFDAIWKAFKRNQKGKNIRGGSTITQQVAKNVFLWPGRSYIRKAFEMYFTVLIELLWSKERIMCVYLNVIEMGNGIYGIEAAARHYFHKSAIDLNKAEAAAIAAVLPNPRHWSANKPTPFIIKRQRSIVRRMNKLPIPEL